MTPEDVFSDYDPLLARAWAARTGPWFGPSGDRRYQADLLLLSELLTVPRKAGSHWTSGRLPKALDSWIAHELRRSGFHEDEVWPRMGRQPRVSSPELAKVEKAVTRLETVLGAIESDSEEPLKPKRLRDAITGIGKSMPNVNSSNILGRFYVKQVDVAVSSWDRGPDVLISGKTQFAKYSANRNNRYEETLGEATNLKDRHPMAAMGYAFIVGSDIFNFTGSYARLEDLLTRTRKPDGPYDATMLLVGEQWTDTSEAVGIAEASSHLTAGRFFEDLLDAVVTNTPGWIHEGVRRMRSGGRTPPGGAPQPLIDGD